MNKDPTRSRWRFQRAGGMGDLGMRSLDNVKQPSPKASLGEDTFLTNGVTESNPWYNSALVAIFQILAIVLTVFRLIVRFRKRRLWWEDLLAGVAAVGAFIVLVTFWVRIDPPPSKSWQYLLIVLLTAKTAPVSVPGSVDWKRVNTYWFVSLGFTCVLWAARMSMMFSIIRITPPMHRLRVVSKWSSALFVVCWISLMAQKLYICTTTQETWHLSATTECHLGKSVAILELCSKYQLIYPAFWNGRLMTSCGSWLRLRLTPRSITFVTPMENHLTPRKAEIDHDSVLCQYPDIVRQHRACRLPLRPYLPPRMHCCWNWSKHVPEQLPLTEGSQTRM